MGESCGDRYSRYVHPFRGRPKHDSVSSRCERAIAPMPLLVATATLVPNSEDFHGKLSWSARWQPPRSTKVGYCGRNGELCVAPRTPWARLESSGWPRLPFRLHPVPATRSQSMRTGDRPLASAQVSIAATPGGRCAFAIAST